jgi:hypothetical protein
MDGPVYHGEIHATPVNDRDDAHPELTNESLCMLKPGYHDCTAVEDALGRVGDRSLGAEVTRWNALKKEGQAPPGSNPRARRSALRSKH